MKTRLEKIFKLEDGKRLKVTAELLTGMRGLEYKYTVRICAKGKRTFVDVADRDDYQYRALSMEERIAYRNKTYITVAGVHRIQSTLEDLWKSIRPEV